MQTLRTSIKRTPLVWLACLLPALLLMLSMQLHMHVHADPVHDADIAQHVHDANLHTAHLGNSHDAEHGTLAHHSSSGTFAVDISPEGAGKNLTLTLLACALIAVFIWLVPPLSRGLPRQRPRETTPFVRWRTALPPPLRAPPR